VAHFTVIGSLSGFPWANTFWMRNGNAQTPSQTDFTGVTNAFGELFKSRLLPVLSSETTIVECVGLYYDGTGAIMEGATSHTGAGANAGGTFPLNVSLCIGWRVQAHYKGGHPRTYLAGIPLSAKQNARTFTSTYVSQVAGNAASFHDDVNAMNTGLWSSGKLGIVSFVNRKEWRTPPIFRDFIPSSAHCDVRIDSQRRRLGRDLPP